MNRHLQLANEAIKRLSGFNETNKLILYGSVAKNEIEPGEDIDIAFICAEEFKWMLCDEGGFPHGLRERIDDALSQIENPENIRFHIPVYWESEFERGIELFSGRKSPPDLLHEVGIVKYDAFCAV